VRLPLIVIVLSAAGCAWTSHPAKKEVVRPASQEEAGSVHLAVLSVGPWDEFVDALQPEFDLTPEGALERVLAPTRISAEHAEDALRLRLAAGAAPPESAPAGPVADAALPQVTLHADAMTQYWAATALYEEVQLLSRYLRHAAIRPGCTAYVVRMQITLIPRRRDIPDDAYATISFFPAGEGSTAEWSNRGEAEPASNEEKEPPAGEAKGEGTVEKVPEVLPLLVTDNLEAGVASTSSSSARELGLAAGGKGGSVGLDVASGESERAAGLDLNSLLTVARVSDNTLRVRLGALQQGTAKYAMVPRTHDITVLVMMPEGVNRLHLVMRTVFVDAETGQELPRRSEARVDELLAQVGAEYGVETGRLRTLLALAQRNDAAAFFAQAKDVRRPENLWLDLVSVAIGGQYAASIVDMQPPARAPRTPELPPPQGVLIEDDGGNCLVSLFGGRYLQRDHLRAYLIVPRDGDRPLQLAPVAPPSLSGGGRELHLLFESLHGRAGLATTGLSVRLEYADEEPATYRDTQYLAPKRKG
jgi:hypothetical protein